MRALLAVLVLLAAPAAAEDWLRDRPAPKSGHAYPQLYCMNRGARVDLGGETCLRTNCCPQTGCEVFTARCELSGNTPMFRKQADGCPENLSLRPTPPATPRPAPG